MTEEGRETPHEALNRSRAKMAEGLLEPGEERLEGKKYMVLLIDGTDGGAIVRNVPNSEGGGAFPLRSGMLVELNAQEKPANKTVRELIEQNTEEFQLREEKKQKKEEAGE